MRRLLFAAFFALASLPAPAAERWETLPPTPPPIPTDRMGEAAVNGIKVHYAIYGHGSPVVFLHGGLANTDYWGNQVPAVAAHHTVILIDSRGHGRSTRDARPYGYDLMADDVVGCAGCAQDPEGRDRRLERRRRSSGSTSRCAIKAGSARCSPSPPTRSPPA